MKTQKTTIIKNKDIKREWHELDAANFTLGRLATQVATLLRGKHKVTFAPHQDGGDFVVVINAAKVKFSGRSKPLGKKYHRYTGFPGGIRTQTLAEKLAKNPESVVREAVREMLDDNRLRKPILRRLHVIADDKHAYPVKK